MPPIQIKSRVGADGVLSVTIPLGSNEANREVQITVEPVKDTTASTTCPKDEWRDFIKKMAGCISDPTFQRQEQGEHDVRREAFL